MKRVRGVVSSGEGVKGDSSMCVCVFALFIQVILSKAPTGKLSTLSIFTDVSQSQQFGQVVVLHADNQAENQPQGSFRSQQANLSVCVGGGQGGQTDLHLDHSNNNGASAFWIKARQMPPRFGRHWHSRAGGSSTEPPPTGLPAQWVSQNFHGRKTPDAVPSYVESDEKKEKLRKMKDYASFPPPVEHWPLFE